MSTRPWLRTRQHVAGIRHALDVAELAYETARALGP
jgi:hypothetical protein